MESPGEPPASGSPGRAEEREHRQRREERDEDASAKRDRSRSPTRQPKKKDFSKGFGWKKKTPKDSDGGLRSGFKDKASDAYLPKRYGGKDDRDKFVERNRDRDRDRDKDRERDGDNERHSRGDRDSGFSQGARGADSHRSGRDKNDDERSSEGKRRDRNRRKEEKPKPATSQAAQAEYIVVTVNDRLGTKARIPCLPSDTIGESLAI